MPITNTVAHAAPDRQRTARTPQAARELQLRSAMRHLFKAQDELALAVHELTHLAREARLSETPDAEDFQRVATRYALAAKTTTEHLVEYAKSLSFWLWYARHRREQSTETAESEAA